MTCTCGPHASDLGACSCGGGQPQPPANPAGLTEISYRANDFAGFRAALLAPLSGEQQLTGWSPGPGDLGLQVLEWWAYLADILTFYNERIANNDYLHTAAAQPGPKRSVAGLARLLGYVPRPGITATGVIAAIRGTGPPGQQLVIPVGTQIASTPAAGAPAQVFETGLTTTRDTPSFAGPSDGPIVLTPDFGLYQPSPTSVTTSAVTAAAPPAQPTATSKSVLLAGQVTVTAGDQLVLVSRNWGGDNADWAVVTAGATSTEPDPNGSPNTRLILTAVRWNDPVGGGTPEAGNYQVLRATATAQLWTMPAINGGKDDPDVPADTTEQKITVPLATLVRNVSTGDNVLFTGTAGDSQTPIDLLAHVLRYREVVTRTRAAPDKSPGTANPTVVMPHTELRVLTTGDDDDASTLKSAVAAAGLGGVTMHYAFREVGTLIPTPAQSLDSLPATVTGPPGLELTKDPAQVALQDANGIGLIVNASAGSSGGIDLTKVEGQPGLTLPLIAPIRLFADLITISRGTSVQDEILGSGAPAAASQSFVLQHSPLIYLPPEKSADPPATTLKVSVDGIEWGEAPAFEGQAPDARVYVVSELADGRIQVRFGDGVNGARLPLGISNVTANYRYAEAAKPPPPGHLVTVLQPQPGLASVINPVSLAPGSEPESATETADAAPGGAVLISTAGSPQAPPLISPGDYEKRAATLPSVTRARAYWAWDRSRQRPAVLVCVAGGTDGTSIAAAVRKALAPDPASRVPLEVRDAHAVPLSISCELLAPPGADDKSIKTGAAGALTNPRTGLFSPRRTAIGEPLYRSQVQAALASSGAVAILSLKIKRLEPAQVSLGESRLDPGQNGYFSLLAKDLTVNVIPQ
jgi:hypothetical protein